MRSVHGVAAGLGLAALGALTGCAGADAGEPMPLLSQLTLAEAGASNPTTAVDAGGRAAYVAWVATEGEQANVYFARLGAYGQPEAPVRVNDVAGDAAPHAQAPAQVAAGPGDDVYVVWQNKRTAPWLDFGGADVRFARSGDGGRSWEPAIAINDDAGGPPARHTFHDVAVADDGTIYVSWIDARERDLTRMERYQARDTAGAGGDAHHAEEPGTEIRVARSTDGGRSFSPGVVLETNSCPCCRTSIATGPDGAVYVTWRKIYEGEVRDIALARSTDGGRTFSEPVRVHADGWVFPGCPHAGADVVVDREGRVHVAWFTGAEGRTGAYYAVSADGGRSFGAPTRLTPEGAVPTTQVSLAADEAGSVWVAWEEAQGTTPAVSLARARVDGSIEWVRMEAPGGRVPSLAAAEPLLAMAWLDGEAVRVLRGTRDAP